MASESADRAIKALIQAGYRYACALQSDAGEARGLVHDAWLKVSAKHGDTPDQPLLFRAIRNIHIDLYRRRERVKFSHTDDQGRLAGDQIDESNVLEMPDRELETALIRLRDNEREALFLSVVEGYTADEISHIMDCPRGTVLSLVHRARLKLKEDLSNDSRVVPFQRGPGRSAS